MRSSMKTALLPAKRVTLNLILKKKLVEEGDTFWAYPETVHANYLLIRGWESEMHSLFSLAEIECWCGAQKSSMLLHQHILMTTRKNVCYRTTLILLQ